METGLDCLVRCEGGGWGAGGGVREVGVGGEGWWGMVECVGTVGVVKNWEMWSGG